MTNVVIVEGSRVTYEGCEVRKKAIEVEQAADNISHVEEVKRVQVRKGKTERRTQLTLTLETSQTESTNNVISVERIMLFIAYVNSCADQVKIQIQIILLSFNIKSEMHCSTKLRLQTKKINI